MDLNPETHAKLIDICRKDYGPEIATERNEVPGGGLLELRAFYDKSTGLFNVIEWSRSDSTDEWNEVQIILTPTFIKKMMGQ